MIEAGPRLPRRGARCSALAAALALLVATAAGCGGSSGGGQQTAASTPSHQRQLPRVIVQTADSGFNPARVYREAAPGVVTIRSVFNGGGLLGGPSAAEGSGIVLDTDGEIVTNAHVVTDKGSGGPRRQAKAVFVEFPDRNVVPAKIEGYDPFADVALLKVNPDGLDLEPLKLGDDRNLMVGQPVAAIGSPFGEKQSLSVGIVSATDRSVKSLTQFQIEGAIQTDASINPGNSGGPLLDASARVIGINQQIETNSGANDGVGFAVPVSAVKRSLAQLRRDGKVSYAYIGVTSQALYPQLATKLGLDTDHGGLLDKVVPGSPADKAGLKGGTRTVHFQAGTWKAGGDVILAVDGKQIVQIDDLSRSIASHHPGDKVTFEVLRDGRRRQVEVTLGSRPTSVTGG